MKDLKVIYFDTETTGLNEYRNDIIQIAGIIEINKEVKEEFEFKCQPHSWNNIEQKALDAHGYSIEEIKKFPDVIETFKKILAIMDKYIDKFDKTDKLYPAGQNVPFDQSMMRQFFVKSSKAIGKKCYWGSYVSYHYLDLLALTRVLQYSGLIEVENLKLGTIAKFLGIEFKAHDALEDIRTTRQCLLTLMDRYLIKSK